MGRGVILKGCSFQPRVARALAGACREGYAGSLRTDENLPHPSAVHAPSHAAAHHPAAVESAAAPPAALETAGLRPRVPAAAHPVRVVLPVAA